MKIKAYSAINRSRGKVNALRIGYILVIVIAFFIVGCQDDVPSIPLEVATPNVLSTATATSSKIQSTPIVTERLTATNVPTTTPAPVSRTPTLTPNISDDALILDTQLSSDSSEVQAIWQEWAQQLSEASTQTILVRPSSATEVETMQALQSGDVHIAFLSSLAYVLGIEQGQIEVAAMSLGHGRASTAVMFITSIDSGLVPGEPPEVLQQLAGKRPCQPDPAKTSFLLTGEIVIPAGLLALHSVEAGQPVTLVGGADTAFYPDLHTAVFQDECDYAVVDAVDPEIFANSRPGELSHIYFEQYAEEMQILYTTPPIMPFSVVALSPQLEPSVREAVTQAVLAIPGAFPDIEYEPLDETLYEEFSRIVAASGIDIEAMLANLGTGTEEAASPSDWVAAPADTIVIDVQPRGGAPFLPFIAQSQQPLNRLVMPAIYAELVRLDAQGSYVPLLVQEVPTLENGLVRFVGEGEDEQLEVEFRLPPNAQWQDGALLTAADLVFSWHLVMRPEWPGSHSSQAGVGFASDIYVAEVEAVADDRIVYRFMSQRQAREAAQTGGQLADPMLYADLAQQVGPVVPLDFLDVGRNVFPQHLLQNILASDILSSDFAQRPIFAGPYRLVEGGGDSEPVVLEAFADFVLGEPAIERVVFGSTYYSVIAEPYWQEPESLAAALAAGAIQAQLGLPAVRIREGADPRAFDALPGTQWGPRFGWEVLDFNLDNPHLADLQVRQAIAHALDRQTIIEETVSGYGTLMQSYLPPWHPEYAGDGNLPAYPFDPARARDLLTAAGYDLSQFPATHPTRGPLILQLASMDVAAYPRQGTAALIQEFLANVGIQVEISFYGYTEFEGQDCTAVRNGRQFDLGLAGWLGGARYYLWWVEHVTHSGSIPTPANGCPLDKANWTGWQNGRVDDIVPQLMEGRLALEEPDTYFALWVEHQQLWATELPSLPLFNVQRPIVIATELQGVAASPFAFEGGVQDTWNIFAWELK